MSDRPPFPEVIDSSIRGAFVSCPRKCELQYFEHWAPPTKSIHLTGGGAFASGLETARRAFWEHGLSPRDSVALGVETLIKEWIEPEFQSPKSTKTLAGFILALADYFQKHGFATDVYSPMRNADGTIAAEFSFALPISDELLHPVTGQPILYCGRADLFAYHQDGSLWLIDEKTTTQLGDNWISQWALRGQFTGYTWAAREVGYPVRGVIARGVSLLKNDTGFAESVQYRTAEQVAAWKFQLIRDIRRMIETWESGYFDRAFDTACSAYSGCDFREVCQSPNPDLWLERTFIRRPWSPIGKMPTEGA